MRVTEIQYTSSADDWFYREGILIKINDKSAVRFLDGEPEDATLARDYSGVYRITELMEQAYNAGANGESFELEVVETNDIYEL